MKKEVRSERFQLRCTKEQRETLEAEAKKRCKAQSTIIWEALEEYFKNHK